MTEKKQILLNDDLFLKTVSCPLKYHHITESKRNGKRSNRFFRQRNKLHVRDAIAIRFENSKHTSNSTQLAKTETETWLQNENVAICGAVIQHDELMTRIPILRKQANNLTIIQVHGKLRKGSEVDEIKPGIKKRSTLRYLMKAAYRLEVLKRKFPNYDVDVQFYFPNKHFKSVTDHLHLFNRPLYSLSDTIKKQLSDLFLMVQAKKATEWVQKEIPSSQSHQIFNHNSISTAIHKIKVMAIDSPSQPNIDRQTSCKYCDFRLSERSEADGCWSQFFASDNVQNPEKHVYELIGHGNHQQSEKGSFYQEQADLSRGYETAQKITNEQVPNISIIHRRNLQIQKARNLEIPNIWLKQNIKIIKDLLYPLHFLDFEAATFALPLKKQSCPYTSAYFQFSCHTLYESGELVHTEWLDLPKPGIHPHEKFVQELGKIPGIFDGTIMQYSPFERQGINRLIADFKREPVKYQQECKLLETIRAPKPHSYEHRFFDVSKLIREYYFNQFLDDSLGLKQVLKGVVEWEKSSNNKIIFDGEMNKILFSDSQNRDVDQKIDPYQIENDSDVNVSNGSEAMHAWLSYKLGLLTQKEKTQVPVILKKYCALDSYALFVIYKHIMQFIGSMNGSDYIRFEQT